MLMNMADLLAVANKNYFAVLLSILVIIRC